MTRSMVGLVLLGLVIPAIVLATGCQSKQQTRLLQTALEAYDAGQFANARERSTNAAQSGPAQSRDAARYLAGMSAYRLGDMASARVDFESAARANDPVVAARAKAMLGIMLLADDRAAEAAPLLESAAAHLPAADAARARRLAADAERRAEGTTSWTKTAVDSTPSGFALQVGVFSDRDRAARAADDAGRVARTEHLGAVRIVERTNKRGDELYHVQVGRFRTRSDAAGIRSRIGRLDYIVTPVAHALP